MKRTISSEHIKTEIDKRIGACTNVFCDRINSDSCGAIANIYAINVLYDLGLSLDLFENDEKQKIQGIIDTLCELWSALYDEKQKIQGIIDTLCELWSVLYDE